MEHDEQNRFTDGSLIPYEQVINREYEVATFAAGSFWRVEAIFRRVRGGSLRLLSAIWEGRLNILATSR